MSNEVASLEADLKEYRLQVCNHLNSLMRGESS